DACRNRGNAAGLPARQCRAHRGESHWRTAGMKYWTLTEADIDRIAIGCGILGTGGGGSTYHGLLRAKALLREGKRIRMVRPAEMAPDAQILGIGGIGAPTVGIEKIAEGGEGVRLLKAVEQ